MGLRSEAHSTLAALKIVGSMNGENVRMVEPRSHPRLALKDPAGRRVRQIVEQTLDRDRMFEPDIEGAIDHAHVAFTDRFLNVINQRALHSQDNREPERLGGRAPYAKTFERYLQLCYDDNPGRGVHRQHQHQRRSILHLNGRYEPAEQSPHQSLSHHRPFRFLSAISSTTSTSKPRNRSPANASVKLASPFAIAIQPRPDAPAQRRKWLRPAVHNYLTFVRPRRKNGFV